jgi:hypothetical protein
MTTPSSNPVPAVPAAVEIARELTEDETASDTAAGGDTVGRSDAEADRARAAGEEIPADATRDSDGVPVGDADAAADERRTRD